MNTLHSDIFNHLAGIDRADAASRLVDERLEVLRKDKVRVGFAGGWVASDLFEYRHARAESDRIVPSDYSGDPCISALIAGDDAELGRLVREAVTARLREEASDEISDELDAARDP